MTDLRQPGRHGLRVFSSPRCSRLLAAHEDLTAQDLFDLVAIYRAMGYEPGCLLLEVAQPRSSADTEETCA